MHMNKQNRPLPATDMIEATATVISLDGDRAVLETKRTSACSGCGAAAGCGTSALGAVFGRKQNRLSIKNSFDATPGEQVIIGMAEKDLLVASLTVYMIPLGAMIIAALIALGLGLGDGLAGLASLAGLGMGLWAAKRLSGAVQTRFTPVFLRRSPLPLASRSCGK